MASSTDKREFLAAMEEAWDLGYQAGLAASADGGEVAYTHGYLAQIIYQAADCPHEQARRIANRAATEILSLCKVQTPSRPGISA